MIHTYRRSIGPGGVSSCNPFRCGHRSYTSFQSMDVTASQCRFNAQTWIVWFWSSAVRIVKFSRSDCSRLSPFTPATLSSRFLLLNPSLRPNDLAASVVSLPSSIKALAVTILPLESCFGEHFVEEDANRPPVTLSSV